MPAAPAPRRGNGPLKVARGRTPWPRLRQKDPRRACASDCIPGRPRPRARPPAARTEAHGQVRSGQVYYSAEVQDHEGQAKKTFES